jgi:hypothetical protein
LSNPGLTFSLFWRIDKIILKGEPPQNLPSRLKGLTPLFELVYTGIEGEAGPVGANFIFTVLKSGEELD